MCPRDAFILFSVCICYVKIHIDLTKTSNHEFDKYVDSGMMAILTGDDKFQDVNIMGVIVDPLFQSNLMMIAVGLCTENKYEVGCSDFLDRMACYFEVRDEYPVVLLGAV